MGSLFKALRHSKVPIVFGYWNIVEIRNYIFYMDLYYKIRLNRLAEIRRHIHVEEIVVDA